MLGIILGSDTIGKATLACVVRTNLRFKHEISPQKLVDIFKGKEKKCSPYFLYLYGFFEECYPSLLHKFMQEQEITRQQILHVFSILPDGEKFIGKEFYVCDILRKHYLARTQTKGR